MANYTANPLNAIDNRAMSLRIGSDTEVYEFNESFNISASMRKTVVEVQNTASITISNLTPERRNFLVGYFSQWDARNRKQPFVPIDLRIGRQSKPDKLITLFRGAILETALGNPPDIDLRLKCTTSLIDMNLASTDFITKTLAKITTHKELCIWAANLVNMPLRYEVSIALPAMSAGVFAGVIQRAYSLTAVVGLLANFQKDKVAVFVDDGELVVTEWGKALQGTTVDVNATTGLIGIPAITQWGVQFTTMADAPIRLAGGVNLFSELNPSVNQPWVITGVEYTVTSRDTAFYATWMGSPSA